MNKAPPASAGHSQPRKAPGFGSLRMAWRVLELTLGLTFPALAQQVDWPPPAGTIASLCAFNTSLPTIASGQAGYIQCDSNGRLLLSSSGTIGNVNQGSAGSNAQAWWVRLGDATNGPAAVKPASTAPLSTDPALVVAISPNGQNPNGQALSANSQPVVIASDQSSVSVLPSPSATASAGLSTTSSTALETAHLIKTGAGNLYSFQVSADSTLSGAAWWVMIFDATSAPTGAVTPKKCYSVPSGATAITAGFSSPISFTTGIEIAVSTTGCLTSTASAHAYISGDFK